jgi:uncharacterized membrane protein YcaP (DUF421 family)
MTVIQRIFDHPSWSDAGIIAAKTAAVYAFLILGLRLLGKRELGQMSIYDLVMIVVLGNAVQNAMINNDNTLGGGVVAAVVLLALNRGVNATTTRSKKVERLLVGEPVLIVHNGVPNRRAMAKEGVSREQIHAALREHGIEQMADVHMCVLEVDGTISVVPRHAPVMRTRRHYRGVRLP